ncbi:D111/G-patch domain-containing protein [Wolffia australiana]
MGGGRRRSSRPSGSIFVEGGVLGDWQGRAQFSSPPSIQGGRAKNNAGGSASSSKIRGDGKKSSGSAENSIKMRGSWKACNYCYPDNSGVEKDRQESGDESVSAPGADPPSDVPLYDYYPGSFSELHLGLGFQREGQEQENEKPEEEDLKESAPETPAFSQNLKGRNKRNPGFLSIGGLKLYTEDISSPEDDSDGNNNDSDSEDEASQVSSEDSSEEDASSEDFDEELAQDYIEGIGGTDELFKAAWLTEALKADALDDLSSSDSGDDSAGKLGPVALMNASREYGMMKAEAKRKGAKKKIGGISANLPIRIRDSSHCEELMFSKDRRATSRKHTGASSQLSRSWPSNLRKSRPDKKIRGEKKRLRKESIDRKRRERALNRGVDLQQINLELKRMVLSETDMFAFQPMHSRDCAQVQRLASIYRLQSGRQGSGKKRFVTVLRTRHTSLPSSDDVPRLEKMLGLGEESDFSASQGKGGNQGRSSAQTKQRRNPSDKEGSRGRRAGPVYADNPVSFISSGVMQTNADEPRTAAAAAATAASASVRPDAGASRMGAFELHTKGFGSRMMAKMGFAEGTGLGRDRQGIVQPIEAVRRPKSLGLGVQFQASDVEQVAATAKTPPQRSAIGLGSFERHTTGFGSKMMAKMGYVPGSGLGKEAQGIATPLSAVKLPKSVGLGRNYTR